MSGWNWPNGLSAFHSRLANSGFKVSVYQAKTKRWHAKVAIRTHKSQPIAAIIGSSNLTRPPYGIAPIKFWNYECDVTIWKDTKLLNKVFRSEGAINQDDEFAIATILDDNVSQPNESDRLEELLSEIRGADDEFTMIE